LSDDFEIYRRAAEENEGRLNNDNLLLKTDKNNLIKDLSNQKSDVQNIMNSQKAEIEFLSGTNTNILKDKENTERELNQQKLNLLNEIESMRLSHSKYTADNDLQLAANAEAYNNLKRENDVKTATINELNNMKNSLITDLNRTQNE